MAESKEKRQLKMIEKFQCPGCTLGSNTKCGSFELLAERNPYNNSESFRCENHSAGTFILGAGNIYLGLPTGFNKTHGVKFQIKLYLKDEPPHWNHLNVPVWAMKKSGFVFTRLFCPRINVSYVEVWEKGSMPKNAIDVGKFVDEID